MGHKLAIDFGTTNSVLARWNEGVGAAEILAIPGLSGDWQDDRRPLVPSLLYVQDGRGGQVTVGQAVIDGGLDRQRSNRLFRGFKRGITAGPLLEPRLIDGASWTDQDAGRHFLRALLRGLPFPPCDIEQLAVTVPVTAFEGYAAWLDDALPPELAERIHLVDESTAAALGYAVTKPNEVVLVVDLGGGTLDIALVELPENRSKTGGLLRKLFGGMGQRAASVIAKAGASLGGSDVDQWLLAAVLERCGLSRRDLGQDYAPLLAACEEAKIDLSTAKETTVAFEIGGGRRFSLPVTRTELERLMAGRGFFTGLRQAVDQAMSAAHRRGIYREDVRHVLLVGGVSLTPSVQQVLKDYFGDKAVRADRPFTAVAEGALQVAIGYGLEDHLAHSYGLRYLDTQTGDHAYDEVIPEGSRYPTRKPVEIVLGAAHPDQQAIEFVVGQIESGAVSTVEVQYQDGQAVFVAQANQSEQRILPMNTLKGTLVRLDPPGQPGEDRLRATFAVDERRRLRLTVVDLKTDQRLLRDAVVATLGQGEPPGTAEDRAGPGGVSGHEPALSAYARPGRVRLSLRGVASMLNILPPESISLEAAAEALRSPDCTVRYAAAEMLSKRNDRDARRILHDVLENGTAPQRASVVRHFHRLSWFGAEPLLRHAFADEDDRVHESAIFAVCKMRSREAYQLAQAILPGEADSVRREAAWALKDSRDPRAVPILEIALQAQDPRVREMALEALGATETMAALPAIRQAVDDADPDVTYAAALSLVELAGEEAFPEVAHLIEGTRGRKCRAILRGFFHATNYLFIDVAATPDVDLILDALQTALGDGLAETRLAAIMPLARMRDERAGRILKAGYRREPDGETQARILYYAVLLESPAGHDLLAEALSSPDPHVREMAGELAEYLEYRESHEGARGWAAESWAPLTEIAQVTPGWLTGVLRERGYLPQGEVVAVEAAVQDPLGAYHLQVAYSADVPPSVPRRLYLKIGGGSTFAGAGEQEIALYTQVAPQMAVPPAVHCYDAAYDAATGGYHLLLEDLSATHRHVRREDAISRQDVEWMLDVLARLHAYWWDHMWLGGDIGTWPTEEAMRADSDRLSAAFPGYVAFLGERLPAAQGASPDWGRAYQRILTHFPDVWAQRIAGHRDLTVVHNDAHAGNYLLPREPEQDRAYLVDWRQWSIGIGPCDLATLIVSLWPPERRAELEQTTVRDYHARLRAYGGMEYDWEACWRDYRLGAIQNLLVPLRAWADGTWAEGGGQQHWEQLERAVLAFQDLHCEELLGS
jgi:molecular chaperone DnaK (HSP70)/HEAT repeat protein